MSKGPRYIAIEVLCRWTENHLPIDQVMEKYFSSIDLDDPRDRQLSMSLVYGAIRWQGYLDWVIGEFSKHPQAKMKNKTLQGLRVGLFQLFFLDRVPPSAAINETVQALKDMKQPKWLTGFVNGILRNVERQRQSIPTPFNNMPLPATALLSHPEWLIKRWKTVASDFWHSSKRLLSGRSSSATNRYPQRKSKERSSIPPSICSSTPMLCSAFLFRPSS